jgi:integrase
MSLDVAAGRYWSEKGHLRGDAATVEYRIAQLLVLLGAVTRLGDIDQKAVAEAIERRRGLAIARGRKKGAKAYLPSNATVNRDVIETLRPILKRARTHWTSRRSSHGLPDIDWRELRMPEPRGQSRLYSDEERAAWLAACEDEPARIALDLLLTYGLRFGELFFPLSAVDLNPTAPTLTLQKGRKRDVLLYIPLRKDHARSIGALLGIAQDKKLPHIWFRKLGKKLVALTYSEMEGRLSRAADAAGIGGGRRIHGARHHAGSTILKRTGGNLMAVKSLLGHATIASSQRYAHMAQGDLRAALEDEVPALAPVAVAEGE